MTQDEMEAQSWRYGPKLVMIVPLTSGRLAVCSSRRDVITYVDTLEQAKAATAAYHTLQVARPNIVSSIIAAIDIEDLL